MAAHARVGDAGCLRKSRREKPECVAGDEDVAILLVGKYLGDVRHVAGGALTARTARPVVGVLRDGALQPRGILLRMTGEAELVASGDQVRGISIAVHLVAVEAAEAAVVHGALDEVVALHAILVGTAVGKEVKVLRAELSFFEM